MGRFTRSDTPITMVRNLAVREALQGRFDYTLMIDSDMSPDYEVGKVGGARPFWDTAWEFMMNRREAEEAGVEMMPATICAPYCGPPPFENVYIFKWTNRESENPNIDFMLLMLERQEATFRAGIEEAAALPTGLILYDNRTFSLLEKHGVLPFFDYEWKDKYQSEKATTEDVYQTRNASLIGCPQYVCWDSWAIHNKLKGVRKPAPITRSMVSESLSKALDAKHEKPTTKILMVNPYDPQYKGPKPSVVAAARSAGNFQGELLDAKYEHEALELRPGPLVVPADRDHNEDRVGIVLMPQSLVVPEVGRPDLSGGFKESGGGQAERALVSDWASETGYDPFANKD